MTRKHHVLVDVDGVLAQSHLLIEALNLGTGLDVTLDQWTSFDLTQFYPITPDRMCDLWREHDVIRRMQPVVGAREAMEALQLEYYVHIVTSRAWHPQGHAHTKDWLESHGLVHDTLTVLPLGEEKSTVYRSLAPRFEAFFDDALHNLKDAAASGLVVRPILIDQPWNREAEAYRFGRNRFKDLHTAVTDVLKKTRDRAPALG